MKVISAPCRTCATYGHHGSRHSLKLNGGKATLVCLSCGSGWIVDLADVPAKAPVEIIVQTINNRIVNEMATFMKPQLPDADAPTT
jgi:uncharacterized Zn finger protein